MEEALRSLNIVAKMLARRTTALWDILLGTEQEAKQLAGSVLSTASIRLQTEYMGTRRTKIIVHGVPVDICEDRMEAFFAKFGQIEEVNTPTSKAGIATGDMIYK